MNESIEKITWFLTLLAGLFVIFLLLWKLLGDSPTVEEVIIGLVFLLASWTINLSTKLAASEGRAAMFEKKVKDSFERVKEDLHRIETKIDAALKK